MAHSIVSGQWEGCAALGLRLVRVERYVFGSSVRPLSFHLLYMSQLYTMEGFQ